MVNERQGGHKGWVARRATVARIPTVPQAMHLLPSRLLRRTAVPAVSALRHRAVLSTTSSFDYAGVVSRAASAGGVVFTPRRHVSSGSGTGEPTVIEGTVVGAPTVEAVPEEHVEGPGACGHAGVRAGCPVPRSVPYAGCPPRIRPPVRRVPPSRPPTPSPTAPVRLACRFRTVVPAHA